MADTGSSQKCGTTIGVRGSLLNRFLTSAASPVDASSLAVFRVCFGVVLAYWACGDILSGRVDSLYIQPRFHLSYYLFDWVKPWPGTGMLLHFWGLLILALLIAAGFLYRLSSVLFALGFSYFFLLDRTNYQNHYYLIVLLSWVLAIIPAQRCVSIDVLCGLAKRTGSVPAWCLWLLRFHIALPYFFGGIAKLQSDWFAGEPLRTHLRQGVWLPAVQSLFGSEVFVTFLTWGGLLFDLAIVPLLIWKRTRSMACVLCLGFHLTNAYLFQIHIFPWFMMLATTIFFAPDWPRRLLKSPSIVLPEQSALSWNALSRPVRAGVGLLVAYVFLHIVLPLRPFLYPGESAWTERAHHFSWRMMARTKDSVLRIIVTDPQTMRAGAVDLSQFVNLNQLVACSRDPEMILQLAQFIGGEFEMATGRPPEVRALVITSLNGRKPELLIDPRVDLMREPRGFYSRSWILPQLEPLREEPWLVPMHDWEKYVEIPQWLLPKHPQQGQNRPQALLSNSERIERVHPQAVQSHSTNEEIVDVSVTGKPSLQRRRAHAAICVTSFSMLRPRR